MSHHSTRGSPWTVGGQPALVPAGLGGVQRRDERQAEGLLDRGRRVRDQPVVGVDHVGRPRRAPARSAARAMPWSNAITQASRSDCGTRGGSLATRRTRTPLTISSSGRPSHCWVTTMTSCPRRPAPRPGRARAGPGRRRRAAGTPRTGAGCRTSRGGPHPLRAERRPRVEVAERAVVGPMQGRQRAARGRCRRARSSVGEPVGAREVPGGAVARVAGRGVLGDHERPVAGQREQRRRATSWSRGGVAAVRGGRGAPSSASSQRLCSRSLSSTRSATGLAVPDPPVLARPPRAGAEVDAARRRGRPRPRRAAS